MADYPRTSVDDLAGRVLDLQEAERRVAALDAFLSINRKHEHPHPGVKRIRDEYARHAAAFHNGLRDAASRYLDSVTPKRGPIDRDEVIARIDSERPDISLADVTAAITRLGLSKDAVTLVMEWMEQES